MKLLNLAPRRFFSIVALYIPALGACQRAPISTQPPASVAPAPVPAPASLRDDDIVQAIRRYMSEDGPLRGQHVQVTVGQGIALLSGSVTTLVAKERASAVAGTIRGVRSVVNQVTVAPSARADAQIKSDVTRELRADLATNPHATIVDVKDGVVTLSGVVDSWQEKVLIGDVSKAVEGVRDLQNKITVHDAITRPGAEIAAEVKYRIANDKWLDGTVIAVTAKERAVQLRGVVGSFGQRLQAHDDAWVAGVDEVDDSGIVVDWFARDKQRRITDFPFRSDAEVAQAVRSAFRYDPRLKTLEPKVAVQNGTAVLSGTVDSPRARRAAEGDAKATVGVWQVRDEVLVQPATTPTDTDIDRAAQRVLADDSFLPDRNAIRVSTSKGKVALSGTITSGFERFNAVLDVASVPGVVEVDDQLAVQRTPTEVKTAIEDQLLWDAMVERDRVDVTVSPDRVATLTGTLDSWAEIKAASDDALRGGASRVINLLKLKGHPEFAP